ncbi:flagellar hook protein FlgE [Lutibacter sp. B2]|nr:flagellar hook protein FlgE [Lutibacter sp. B2]
MMRSMFSAVSGLKAHQFKMDVIGNNIANVNTVGFKGSRVTFKETFSQTLKGAGGGDGGRGGTNPMQVGLGADVGSVDVNHTIGVPERTDNPTDLMINGEGFFMVSNDPNAMNKSYTRAGNFVLDNDGNLVTQEGYKVLGYMADETGRLKSGLEGLKVDKSAVYPPQATKISTPPIEGEDIVKFTGNLDSGTVQMANVDTTVPPTVPPTTAIDKIIDGIYQLDTIKTENAGHPVYMNENDEYNKAIGKETTVSVFDDFGNVHNIKMIFAKQSVGTGASAGTSTWKVDAFYVDDDGAMIKNGTTNKYDPVTGAATGAGTDGFKYLQEDGTTPGTFTITFDKDGKVVGNSKMKFTIGKDLTDGADQLDFEMNLNKLTQFSDTSNAAATKIKGYKQGSLTEYAVASSGEIIGVFSNGERRVLGRVALANFTNPAGLQKTQSNMYNETRNSGMAVIGKAASNGFSSLNPGSLEMSNVDLGQEFTNMITTQRGFQANSKVITTTDEMLQELVNLKR